MRNVRCEAKPPEITFDVGIYFRDISLSDHETVLGKLKADKNFTDTSRGHYLGGLKSFLNWAYRNQRIGSNPIASMEKPQRDDARKGNPYPCAVYQPNQNHP